jgi:DNA invertase Pin-like site-specific DNA recombinase
MRIGYARVSTVEQNLDLQLDALKASGCKRIYEEHASGRNAERTELVNCLKALRADDVLVVWRLDRLGRNLPDLVRIAGELEQRKVDWNRSRRKSRRFHPPANSSSTFFLRSPSSSGT